MKARKELICHLVAILIVGVTPACAGETVSEAQVQELERMIAEVGAAIDQASDADVAVTSWDRKEFQFDPHGRIRRQGAFSEGDFLRFVREQKAKRIVVFTWNQGQEDESDFFLPFAQRIFSQGADVVHFQEPFGKGRWCFLTISNCSNHAIHRTPRPARPR